MTTHSHPPMPQDPMPLDPEERALAARLARLGPHGEPSPALDARVLAAAHAATSGGTHGARDARGWRRARWPVGVGVAASVALAAGIAWQMRPLPAPAPMPATPASAEAVQAPQPIRQLAGPMPQEAAGASIASDAAAPANPIAARSVSAAKAMAPPPPEAAAVVFDAPAPVDVAAPPPAPPAPPASSQPQPQSQPRSQAQEALPVLDDDAPETDVPPATVASPQVRDAWLARIRELAAGGRADEARASLAEFHRRYPAFAIPEDLRPLLPPQASSPSQSSSQPPPPPR